ncbi:hypothetical protein [Clostridium thailandense]|uniref:hypothetical protein n=1 Tax=Clostridium thailandense TaxID=2794346 RepID=UPI003988A4CE
MNYNKHKELTDMSTGEIITVPEDFVDNRQDYYIRSRKQDEAYKKKSNKLMRATEHFYWGNLLNINTLIIEKNLSTSALGLLLLLCCQLQNGSDILCTQKKTPYTTTELIELTGVPKRTFVRAMEELQAHGIVINKGTSRKPVFKVDSQYHFVGMNKQANISVRIYKDGIKALQASGLTLNEIGFIYAILPLIDFNRCVLVKDFTAGDKLDNLHSIDSLCEYFGMKRRNLTNYLSMTFKYTFKDGQYKVPVFGVFKSYGSKTNSYLVNPLILRRAVNDIDYQKFSNIEGMFKIHGEKVQ